MARPSSRQELIDYCLRALGEPVLEVNVDPDQIEDRVDEAFQYFTQYHSEGTDRRLVVVRITQDEIDNNYIFIPNNVIYIMNVLPAPSAFNSTNALFDVQYQMMMDATNRGYLLAGDLAYYEQMQQHLSLIDSKLNGTIQFAWNRYGNTLRLRGELGQDIKLGDFIVYEALIEIGPDPIDPNPNGYNSISNDTIYNNMFIKEYTTALIKQQWGQNLIKFEGMQLPGGITLNGRQIYDDATQEIKDLQERLRSEFEEPVDFFVG